MASVVVDSALIRETISQFRQQIGRMVTFAVPDKTQCPVCISGGFIDTNTGNSWNFNCPTCKGSGWVNTMKETQVLARIHWTHDEALSITPGGKYFVGDCRFHIDPDDYPTATAAHTEDGRVYVDGHEMTITKILPEGTPTINRVMVICANAGSKPG